MLGNKWTFVTVFSGHESSVSELRLDALDLCSAIHYGLATIGDTEQSIK